MAKGVGWVERSEPINGHAGEVDDGFRFARPILRVFEGRPSGGGNGSEVYKCEHDDREAGTAYTNSILS